MPWFDVIWNYEPGGNVEHIAEYGLTPEDVEAVICDPFVDEISGGALAKERHAMSFAGRERDIDPLLHEFGRIPGQATSDTPVVEANVLHQLESGEPDALQTKAIGCVPEYSTGVAELQYVPAIQDWSDHAVASIPPRPSSTPMTCP